MIKLSENKKVEGNYILKLALNKTVVDSLNEYNDGEKLELKRWIDYTSNKLKNIKLGGM